MKIWRIILALYVLVLSGVPCEAYCCAEEVAIAQQLPVGDTQNEQHEEGCSPFCICAVCAGFVLPQSQRIPLVNAPTTPVVEVVSPLCRVPYWLDVPRSVWQPPQIG